MELINDPYSLNKWQTVLETAANDTPLIYTEFLKLYPLFVNYHIKFVEFEYHRNNHKHCDLIYERGFRYLSYLIEFWMSYIHYKLTVTPVTAESVLGLLEMLETARGFVGSNYYSFEFYKLYLEFLRSYRSLGDKFDVKYHKLLRYVLELPLHNHSYFFKLASNDPQYSDKALKRMLADLYTVTQYKSFKIYEFEKNITTNYFDIKYLPSHELKVWDSYLEYMQLHYPEFVVATYERCLIATASYNDIWLKFATYLVANKRYKYAHQVLERGIYLGKFNTAPLLAMLRDFQLHNHRLLLRESLV